MSQNLPPNVEGQVTAPNPLELFWEKNKALIITVLLLLVLAMAGNEVWKQMEKAKVNKKWSDINASLGLQKGNTDLPELMGLPPVNQENQQIHAFVQSQALQKQQMDLLAALAKDLDGASEQKLQDALDKAKGKPMEPWILWVWASKDLYANEFDKAEQRLAKLEKEFPKHFLCTVTKHPPQVRAEKPPATEEEEDKDKPGKKKEEAPELEAAIEASPLQLMRKTIASNRAVLARHAEFFAAPEPKGTEIFVVKTDFGGDIHIQLYSQRAPKHAEAFKALVAQGFFDGMRIHKIKRNPSNDINAKNPRTIHWGLEASRADDTSKWLDEDADKVENPNRKPLDFETNDLSFFPGMLAAEAVASSDEADAGKSSRMRVFININDCADSYDGEYVIFGKVVDGLDLATVIQEASLSDEEMEQAGEGTPGDYITIESITVQ